MKLFRKVSCLFDLSELLKVFFIDLVKLFALSVVDLLKLFTLAALLIMVGCATEQRAHFDTSMENKIIWPGPPEKPRIRYLWSFTSLLPEGSSVLDVLTGKYEFFEAREAPILLKPMYVYQRGDDLYIADSGAQRVTVVNLKTNDFFHVGTSGDGSLADPVCVVTDRDGNIYVSDSAAKKIFKYDPQGNFIKSISREGMRPVGLAYDEKSDTLFIVDTDNHDVIAADRDGNKKFIIGKRGEGDGEFNFPTYCWADNNGRLYVSDTMNARIEVFDTSGKFLFKFGSRGGSYNEFARPKGVATDTHGNIYVVDSEQGMIKIFNKDGRLLLFFGEEGKAYGKFTLPNGIFINHNNVIYVADTYNMRVQAFQLIEEQ